MMTLARPKTPRQSSKVPSLLAALLGLALTACAPLPDITAETEAAAARRAPVLVPIEGILAQADAVAAASTEPDPVTARADTLRARADALRSQ